MKSNFIQGKNLGYGKAFSRKKLKGDEITCFDFTTHLIIKLKGQQIFLYKAA
jgi:hypothetical protein